MQYIEKKTVRYISKQPSLDKMPYLRKKDSNLTHKKQREKQNKDNLSIFIFNNQSRSTELHRRVI